MSYLKWLTFTVLAGYLLHANKWWKFFFFFLASLWLCVDIFRVNIFCSGIGNRFCFSYEYLLSTPVSFAEQRVSRLLSGHFKVFQRMPLWKLTMKVHLISCKVCGLCNILSINVSVPETMGRLRSLERIDLMDNNVTGGLPVQHYNIRSSPQSWHVFFRW